VRVIVEVSAATAVSGDVGFGALLPPGPSASACPSPGDSLLFFPPLGTGGGTLCLSRWLSTPGSRIVQFPGVTLPAGTQFRAELLQLPITASLDRAVFVVFGYILDSATHNAVLDLAATTLDLE
jgi:hypothetical protein